MDEDIELDDIIKDIYIYNSENTIIKNNNFELIYLIKIIFWINKILKMILKIFL